MKFVLLLLALLPFSGFSQDLPKDKSIRKILALPDKEAIKTRIKFLADDKLQGRRASSAGYKVAVEYVIVQFKQLGIAPQGDEGYIQKVIIRTGKIDSSKTSFVINGQSLK